MGTRGPAPKRTSQRRRRNAPAQKVRKAPAGKRPAIPKALAKWHPIAKRWYASLARSGQSEFYEAGDWQTAFLLAESISRELKPQVVGVTEDGEPFLAEIPPKGASLAAWRQTMAALLVTEGDRRRAGVELERGPDDEEARKQASVSELSTYRKRLSSG